MKTIILLSLCLCLFATAISAEKHEKSHKHQGKLLKSGHEEHKEHTDLKPADKTETEPKTPAHIPAQDQAETKPAGSGRKHRSNHHGKNKKGGTNTEAHTGRSRKGSTKANKHNGQKSHSNKHHGRKHGRKQGQ